MLTSTPLRSRTLETVWPQGIRFGWTTSLAPARTARAKSRLTSSLRNEI